jgi:hypothetical protein
MQDWRGRETGFDGILVAKLLEWRGVILARRSGAFPPKTID